MKRNEQIESVVAAHRERTARGEILAHPSWSDLAAAGRREAFERAVLSRRIEAAMHEDGLSSTALAVLDRIQRAGRGA